MRSTFLLIAWLALAAAPPRHVSEGTTRADTIAEAAWRPPEPTRLETFESADFRVTLPRAFAVRRREERETPWGKATTEFAAGTASGITYVIQATSLLDGREIPASQIEKTKTAFAGSHKCSVETVRAPALRTADGRTWPQVRFKGSCAAPGDYEILSLIANGRWYQLQVTNDPLAPAGTTEPGREKAPASDLRKALTWLAERIRFTR